MLSLVLAVLLSPAALGADDPPEPGGAEQSVQRLVGPIVISGQAVPADLYRTSDRVEILGDLIVEGPDVTTLEGLERIVRVSGDLRLQGTGLTDLSGLSGLESIGGTLDLRRNAALEDLGGMEALAEIGGGLWAVRNPSLRSLDGLEQVGALGAPGLFLDGSPALTSLEALAGVSSLEGNVFVANCERLESLEGLAGVRRIPGDLLLAELPALRDLRGLRGLTQAGGFVYLDDLDALPSLAGLGALESVGSFLYLGDNDTLVSLEGLDRLSSVETDLDIHSNPALVDLQGLDSLAVVGGDLRVVLNDALVSLRGLSSLVAVGSYLLVYGNDALASLEGLERLRTVGDVYIPLGGQLTDHRGLEALLARDPGLVSGSTDSVLAFEHYASPQLREGQHPGLTVGLSSSGGGLRTGSFLLGVLSFLERVESEDAGTRYSALGEVDYLSTVSGGSMATGAYLSRRAATGELVFTSEQQLLHRFSTNFERSVILSGPKFDDGPPVNRFEDRVAEQLQRVGGGDELRLGDVFLPLSALEEGARPTLPMWAANTTEFGSGNAFPFTPGMLLDEGVCWYAHGRDYYFHVASQESLLEFVEEIPVSVGVAASSTVPPVATLGVMGRHCTGTLQKPRHMDGQASRFKVVEQALRPDPEHLELADAAYSDRYGLLTAVRMTWEDTAHRYACREAADSGAADGGADGGAACEGLAGALPGWSTLFVVYSQPDFGQLWQPGAEAPASNRSLERAFDVLRKESDRARLDTYLGAPTDPADPNSRPLVKVTTGATPIVAVNLGLEVLVNPNTWAQFENADVCRAEMASLYNRTSRIQTRLSLSRNDESLMFLAGQMAGWLQQASIRTATWMPVETTDVGQRTARSDPDSLNQPWLWRTPPPAAFEKSCGDLMPRGSESLYQDSWVYDPRLLYSD